ncbi:MAG TPA: hypothetical protein VMG58_10605 [Candidatus Sulfotelmatobacter sp.]|nr:hypothetical protein [Candidatus Sulfotelmatobacter sp.]
MRQRIERLAVEYAGYAPIPRVALFDIAYPADAAEYAAVDGYGVLLVSLLTQVPEELPPERVYVYQQGSVVELPLLSAAFSTEPGRTVVGAVLGPHRWEGLYLLPVYLVQAGAELLVDFPINRQGFVLSRFTERNRVAIRHLPTTQPTAARPPAEALLHLISRAYPGFLAKEEVSEEHRTQGR